MSWKLPDSWSWASFSDVAAVDANLVQPSDYGAYPHIAPNHIESKTGRLLSYTTIAADGVTSAKHLFKPGHIIYSKIRPYLAKAVLVDFEGLCSADAYPVSTRLNASFLHRWMVTGEFTAQASRSQGRTVLPKINKAALNQLSVPVAPLNEQRRIVAKIDALQARSRHARQALDAIPPLLERFRQSVLAAAFRGDLTADWRAQNPDVEPASVLLERIRTERRARWIEATAEKATQRAQDRDAKKGKTWTDQARAARLAKETVKAAKKYKAPEPVDAEKEGLAELPEGWCWARVEEVAALLPRAIQSGPFGSALKHAEFSATGVLVVGIDNVQDGWFSGGRDNRIPHWKFKELERFQARPLDVLITVMATVGRCAVAPRGLETAIITKHVYRISVEQRMVNPHVLMNSLRGSSEVLRQLGANIRGQTRAGINGGILKRLAIPLPPPEEQNGLLDHIDSLLKTCSRMERQIGTCRARLDTLDQAILAKAFRGELVPQDPTDEPASVLLERIRAERAAAAPKKKTRARRKKT